MDNYNIATFCSNIEQFFDILNNWYIRLSRERFWGTGVSKEIQLEAFNTLYTVLIDISKIIAPIMPFISDFIYKNLTGEKSVHLALYPKSNNNRNENLIKNMDAIISICSTAKNLREEENIKNRQPLPSLTICSNNIENLKEFKSIILTECNVKNIVFTNDTEKYAKNVLYIYTPIVGKRLGSKLKDIISASKTGNYTIKNSECLISDTKLEPNEFELKVEILNGLKGKAISDNSAIVILDTTITNELKIEGIIRDFIRTIQEERKNQNLDVSNRIKLNYSCKNTELINGIEQFKNEISTTTLAIKINKTDINYNNKLSDTEISFNIEKV